MVKKSPISRANILHFETFTLYQNVIYKMAEKARFELALGVNLLSVFETDPFSRLGISPCFSIIHSDNFYFYIFMKSVLHVFFCDLRKKEYLVNF